MADKKLFVSHAGADLETIMEIVGPLRNLPLGLHVAGQEVGPGHSRAELTSRLADSDLMIVFLTETAADDHWVHQEVGFATARDVLILPLVEDESFQRGYSSDCEGVDFHSDQLELTVFNLLSRLRTTLAPLGNLSKPSWYVEFPCSVTGCGTMVTLGIGDQQKTLWQRYKHGDTLAATCQECSAQYQFNPATLGFVGRQDP
jgi:hypothetical protein